MKKKSMMTMRPAWLALALCGALSAPLPALAGGSSTEASAGNSSEALYRKERADCLQGRTSQDRQTCLKEAGAALAESRHGGLAGADPAQLAANAALRCQAVPAEDRAACQAMARGEGQVDGTVAQGGVVKQITTVEPTAAGQPASAPR
jgi:hypothetical protein